MTNGEKIKVAFPHYDIEIDEHKGYVRVFYEDFYTTYPLRWWNAEYKEPTTNNDLGVDCISRADLYNRIKKIDHDEDYECDEFGGSKITYHTCDWDEVLREIEDAPSVTPQEPFMATPCISSKVCGHDRVVILDKIRAEIDNALSDGMIHKKTVLGIIDKYKAESEE